MYKYDKTKETNLKKFYCDKIGGGARKVFIWINSKI